MTTFERATKADLPEIVETANYVFSYSHAPHEFRKLLGKVYAPDAPLWAEHFIAREDGRIRALAAMLPMRQKVLGEDVRYGLVGTVSVHPDCRGKGYMQGCMRNLVEYARENDFDILALGGQRQRYGYYGFEPGGVSAGFDVSEANIRHRCADVPADVRFAPLSEYEGQAWALYERQSVCGARPREHFARICGSWYARPLACLRNGALIGYLIADKNIQNINELVLEDVQDVYAVLKSLYAAEQVRVSRVRAAEPQRALYFALAELCDDCVITRCDLMLLLRPARVVDAYLKLAANIRALAQGSCVLNLGDTRVRVTVDESGARAEETDEAATVDLNARETMSLVLSPTPFADVSHLPVCARDWFPLPLTLCSADTF